MTLTKKRSMIVLAVACLGLFFLGMTSFGVTDPGEGYYVEAAREMVESGDFITPHLNYQIYFSKPILTFWLMAVPYKLFGVSEFSARIAFSLLSTLLVFATYKVARTFNSEFAGLFAGLVIASSPLLIAETRLSPIDVAFSCFVDLAVFSFAMCSLLDRKRWWWVFHAALGLAVLTKGPAGVILFLAGTIAFLVLTRPSIAAMKTWFLRLRPLLGTLIFCAIVLPWYVAIYIATKGLFLKVFFLYENFARFAGHTNLGKAVWWHYLPVIGYGFAPWVVLLPFAAYSIVKARMQMRRVEAEVSGAESRDNKQQFLFYLFIWSLIEFLFFSCSKTKLDTYILPSLAPCAVCLGIKAQEWLKQVENSACGLPSIKSAKTFVGAALVLGVLLLIGGPVASFAFVKAELLSKISIAAGTVMLSAGLILCSRFYKEGKREQAVAVFACGFALAAALAQPVGFQIGSKKRFDDLKLIATKLRGKDVHLAMFNTFKPAVMYYSLSGVDSFFHPHQIEKADALERPLIIIASDKVVDRLRAQPGVNLKEVERSGEWAAYEAVGSKLSRNLTLEEVFSQPQAFEMAISGKGDWGPLAVPFATGDRQWWKKK